MRIVAIIGSRKFPESKRALIDDFVNALPPDTLVVSGGALGVDSWAAEAAKARGLKEPLVFLPEWTLYGKRAGFLRNQKIVDASNEIMCFWDGQSKGSMDTVRRARQKKIPVTILNAQTEGV